METLIRAGIDTVWAATQEPHEHVRWDVRFSRISPRGETPDGATTFAYERRIPLHVIRGTGVSIGERRRPDGARTSALRFDTDDPLSPLRAGRGYWRYVPTADGTTFITGYDYTPGWGVLDVLVRPVVGWVTAWSFDRLRIWLETGTPPERWPLRSVLWWWRPGRPRAGRCRRTPGGMHRRWHVLDAAPSTLADLPAPGGAG